MLHGKSLCIDKFDSETDNELLESTGIEPVERHSRAALGHQPRPLHRGIIADKGLSAPAGECASAVVGLNPRPHFLGLHGGRRLCGRTGTVLGSCLGLHPGLQSLLAMASSFLSWISGGEPCPFAVGDFARELPSSVVLAFVP